jgi:hypothetical protein
LRNERKGARVKKQNKVTSDKKAELSFFNSSEVSDDHHALQTKRQKTKRNQRKLLQKSQSNTIKK